MYFNWIVWPDRDRYLVAAIILTTFLIGFYNPCAAQEAKVPPNIVIILADDMGYGDVSALNSESKISTPAMDKVIANGMHFTDAHSNSAVCTPTRYGLLTGRYAFRSRLKKGVLNGYSPSLIEPGRQTIANFLQDIGYHTACIGKWHLGLDWKKHVNQPCRLGYLVR